MVNKVDCTALGRLMIIEHSDRIPDHINAVRRVLDTNEEELCALIDEIAGYINECISSQSEPYAWNEMTFRNTSKIPQGKELTRMVEGLESDMLQILCTLALLVEQWDVKTFHSIAYLLGRTMVIRSYKEDTEWDTFVEMCKNLGELANLLGEELNRFEGTFTDLKTFIANCLRGRVDSKILNFQIVNLRKQLEKIEGVKPLNFEDRWKEINTDSFCRRTISSLNEETYLSSHYLVGDVVTTDGRKFRIGLNSDMQITIHWIHSPKYFDSQEVSYI